MRHGRITTMLAAAMAVLAGTATFSGPAPVAADGASEWGDAEALPFDSSLSWTFGGTSDISCGDESNCVMVGNVGWPSLGPLAAVMTEGQWGEASVIPDTSSIHDDTGGGGVDVECIAPGDCVIVGAYSPSGNGNVTDGMTATVDGGTLGGMVAVPGLATFADTGTDPQASANSVDCDPTGATCVLGGVYRYGPSANLFGGFVATLGTGANWGERTWGAAQQVPNLQALNTADNARVTGVSCGAMNDCVAIGTHRVDTGQMSGGYPVIRADAFVADFDGTWQNAETVPGLAAITSVSTTRFDAVDCPAAGECVAVGVHFNGTTQDGFITERTGGTWDDAVAIPGLTGLMTGSQSSSGTTNPVTITDVSCASAAECTIVGKFIDTVGEHAFVAEKVNGTWSQAQLLTWAATVGDSPIAWNSPAIDCPAAGECVITGTYRHTDAGSLKWTAYTAVESGGTWGELTAVTGTSAFSATRTDGTAIDCTATGRCIAAGHYLAGYKPFSVTLGPPPASAPAAPTALVPSAGDGQVEIAFAAGSDGGSAITNYEYTTDGGTNWTPLSPTVTASPITITGLDNGTSHTISIRAVNAVGPGATSAAVTVTPVAATTSTPPTSPPSSTTSTTTIAPSTSGTTTTSSTTTTTVSDETIGIAAPKPVPRPEGELPDIDPGQALLMINGVPTEVTTEIVDETTVRVTSGSSTLGVAGVAADGNPRKVDSDGRLTVDEGGLVEVSGSGFFPGTVVDLWVFSEPRYLGNVTVGADGTFSGRLPLPADLLPGDHTVQANGTTSDGEQMSASLGLLVEATGTLPTTGEDQDMVPILVLIAALGGLVTLMTRRRLI